LTARFDGRVSIVTGGANGIGNATAKMFAKEGAKVLIADIDVEKGEKLAQSLRSEGHDAIFVRTDMRSGPDSERMAEEAINRYGRIDILCQNAGIYPVVPFLKMTEADWDSVYSLNLKGTFFALKACLPYMVKKSYGRIVITSSVTGPKVASPGMAHYAATKGGINAIIRTLALEFAGSDIRVNGVEPGAILTEGTGALTGHVEAFKQFAQQHIPLRRMGLPEDVAGAILFLASDDSNFITGQTIVIDGGQMLPEVKQ
jgi:3-oxoacyl-[acyl-carrier protein] reductase